MFLRNLITTSTESYSEQMNRLKNKIKNADSIVTAQGRVCTLAGLPMTENALKDFLDFH